MHFALVVLQKTGIYLDCRILTACINGEKKTRIYLDVLYEYIYS